MLRAILFTLGLVAGVTCFYSHSKSQSYHNDTLNIGLILPHTNFGVREYIRAINNAVAGLHRSRGMARGMTWLKKYNFGTKNVHNVLMTLTPSPTGKTKTITDVLKKVKYITEENGEYKLKKQHKYYGQIQMGMAVLNLPKTYFILYASFDDSILIIEVEFDYDFALQMLSKLKCNYFKNMLHEICDK